MVLKYHGANEVRNIANHLIPRVPRKRSPWHCMLFSAFRLNFKFQENQLRLECFSPETIPGMIKVGVHIQCAMTHYHRLGENIL